LAIKEVEALDLARKIAMFNSEVIYYVKNSLYEMNQSIEKNLNEEVEKFTVLIKTKFPHTDVSLIIANTKNNHNHDLTKLDVGVIKEMLLEGENAGKTSN